MFLASAPLMHTCFVCWQHIRKTAYHNTALPMLVHFACPFLMSQRLYLLLCSTLMEPLELEYLTLSSTLAMVQFFQHIQSELKPVIPKNVISCSTVRGCGVLAIPSNRDGDMATVPCEIFHPKYSPCDLQYCSFDLETLWPPSANCRKGSFLNPCGNPLMWVHKATTHPHIVTMYH